MPGSCNSSVQCALGVKLASYVGYLGSKMFKGKRNEVKRVAKISKAGYCQDFLVQRGNRQLDTMPSRNVSEGRGCCQNFQPTVHPIQKELPLKASTVSPKKLCLVSARMHELQMSPVFMRVFLVYTGLESFCSILSCAIRDSSLPGYEYIAATAA